MLVVIVCKRERDVKYDIGCIQILSLNEDENEDENK